MINLSETEQYDHDLNHVCMGISTDKIAIRRDHIKRLVKQRHVFRSDLPDDPCVRCGYYFINTDYIFKIFGTVDPMKAACELHDSAYDRNTNGGITRKQADDLFLRAMLTIAGDNVWLKMQAYTYYAIARSLGGLVW